MDERPSRLHVAEEHQPAGLTGAQARRVWWVFLVGSVSLLALAALTLGSDSSDTLVTLTAATFAIDAVLLASLAAVARRWRGLLVLAVGMAVVAVLLLVASPDPFRLAMVLAGVLGWRGLIDALIAWSRLSETAGAAARLDRAVLLMGIASMLLGVTALIARDTSAVALEMIVAGQALVRGLGMLAIAMSLRWASARGVEVPR